MSILSQLQLWTEWTRFSSWKVARKKPNVQPMPRLLPMIWRSREKCFWHTKSYKNQFVRVEGLENVLQMEIQSGFLLQRLDVDSREPNYWCICVPLPRPNLYFHTFFGFEYFAFSSVSWKPPRANIKA